MPHHSQTSRFAVRHDELDVTGHLPAATIAGYIQESAIHGSTDAGYSFRWYVEQGTFWVIRRISLRYELPVTYGDDLDIRTWVSTVRRTSSTREYELTRARDGARVARVRAHWIYMDRASGEPARLPDGIRRDFDPTGEVEELGLRLQGAEPVAGGRRHEVVRRVEFQDVDRAGHVKCARYMTWTHEAYLQVLFQAAGSLEAVLRDARPVPFAVHDIEFLEPSHGGESVAVGITPAERLGEELGWSREVRKPETGRLLAREYTRGAVFDVRPRFVTPSRELLQRIV